MEELQKSYIQAVAAAAGCTVLEHRVDANKVDLGIDHRSTVHTHDTVASVRLQLKSTHQIPHTNFDPTPGAYFSFTLDNETLNALNNTVFILQRLLVVMLMPALPEDWLFMESDHLVLRNRCYWVNLVGVPVTGVDHTVVHVPWANVLDAQGLCDVMVKVGSGVAP